MKATYAYRTISIMLLIGFVLTCAFPAIAETLSPAATEGPFEYVIDYDDTVTITKCSKDVSGTVTVPARIADKPVTRIGADAFAQCNQMTGIILPDTLIEIEEFAFFLCKSLQSVTIPDSVVMIGQEAFWYCTSLETIYLGSGLEYLGLMVFTDCSSLTSINVSPANSVYSSKDGVLYSKDQRTLLRVPPGSTAGIFTVDANVTSIGESAFSECINITGVNLPNGLTTIGEYAFSLSGLTSITLPDTVKNVGIDTFNSCLSLKTVNLGNGFTDIPEGMFGLCGSLTSVTFPNNFKTIGKSAFTRCDKLVSIELPDSLTKIDDSAFRACQGLKTIQIPQSVTNIGNNAFLECSSLYAAIFLGNPPATFGTKVFQDAHPYFSIYYQPENAASWAPNGENLWKGYKISDTLPVVQEFLLNEGSRYSIQDGILRGVSHRETVDFIISNFIPWSSLRVFNTNNEALAGDASVSTGYKIRLLDGNTVLGELTIIVKGDVDGNGRVNALDISAIQKHILDIESLSGIPEKAADLDNDGRVNSLDISAVQKILLGI